MPSVRITIRSASLPGVSEPTLESRPIAAAPSIVASSSASRAVRRSSVGSSPRREVAVVVQRPLHLKRHAHLGEQVAAAERDDVATEARAQPAGERAARDRKAHAHLHLGLRRDRDGRPAVRRSARAHGPCRHCSGRAPGAHRAGRPHAGSRSPAARPDRRQSRCGRSRARRARARSRSPCAWPRAGRARARSARCPSEQRPPPEGRRSERTRRASSMRASWLAKKGSASGTG